VSGTIDLDAYCRRIGYAGERAPTLAALREIHRLQPQAIAFENLSPLLGQPVPLDDAALQEKMVHRGRGGYCFEQNLLFAAALRGFGFKLRWLTGWPRWQIAPGRVLPRTHLLLLVDLDGEQWLADVGFGGNTLTGPLLLHSREEQVTPHEPARISDKDGKLMVQVKIDEAWHDLVAFDLDEQAFAELEMGNWFTSTHPKSRFKTELFAARAEPDRRYGLLDNVFTTHRLNGPSERRRLQSAAELRDTLTDLFRIRLPDDPALSSVLARLAEKPQ
jgi:N-hydroxyarylamine O-acetyltransferase